jgi:hypothetical protein
VGEGNRRVYKISYQDGTFVNSVVVHPSQQSCYARFSMDDDALGGWCSWVTESTLKHSIDKTKPAHIMGQSEPAHCEGWMG